MPCQADIGRRNYIMECARVARNINIPVKETRNGVTFLFPDVVKRKERAKAKAEPIRETYIMWRRIHG